MRTSEGIMRYAENSSVVHDNSFTMDDFNRFISSIDFGKRDESMNAIVGIDFLKCLPDDEFLNFVNNVKLWVSQDTYDYAMERYLRLTK